MSDDSSTARSTDHPVPVRRAGQLTPGTPDAVPSGMTLAEKITFLRKHILDEDDKEMSYAKIAQRANDKGFELSSQTVYLLATGKSQDPRRSIMQGIAAAFGISASFFFDEEDAEVIQKEILVLSLMRNAKLQRLAVRMSAMRTDRLEFLGDLIDTLEQSDLWADPGGK